MSARVSLTLATTALLVLLLCIADGRSEPDRAVAKAVDAQASRDLLPRPVKLQDPAIPLSKALTELAKQTGNDVQDRRQDKKDLKLKVNLDNATFWQALDAIAREADLRVSLYSEDRSVALVDGPYRELPVSYDGLFRVAVKRIVAVHDLEADEKFSRYSIAHLEVAWEPRFQAFLLEGRPHALVVKDDKGRAREGPETGKGQMAVGGKIAEEIQLLLPALPRSSASIGLLQGSLSVVGSGRMLEFTFDKLDKFNRKKGMQQSSDGVTVTLDKFTTSEDTWTVGFSLKYPADGPKLESFQSSLLNNKVYLEKGGKRFPHNAGESIDQAGNLAEVRYIFEENKAQNFVLGKPAQWKIVYLTPARISEVPIKFEFKDVPLP